MRFSMSSVFGGAFSILGKGVMPLAIITVLAYLLPSLAMSFVMIQIMGVNPAAMFTGQGGAAVLGLGLVTYALMFLHMSAVTETAVLTAAQKPVNVVEVLTHAAINILPIFVIYILCAIGWFICGIFLLVPALIFGTIFSVVVPAYVAEKPGIFGAFSRSRNLTRGHRWGIFGMWLLILFVAYVVMGAVQLPIMMPMMQQMMKNAASGVPSTSVPVIPFWTTALMSIIGSVMWVVLLVFNASFYTSLRNEKEAHSGGRVEKVFE